MRSLPILLLAAAFLAPPVRAQGCIEPPAGLAGWWDADALYPNPTGALENALDIADPIGSSPARPVTGLGTPQGQVGKAFAFPPSDGAWITVADQPKLDVTTALTVELWVQGGAQSTYRYGLVRKCGNYYYLSDRGFVLDGDSASGRLRFLVGHGGGVTHEVVGTTNVLDGVFHHVAATFDATLPTGNLKLYVDGTLEATATAAAPMLPDTQPLYLGMTSNYWTLTGLMDEISVYDRALGAGEIDAIYHAGGKCKPQWPARLVSSGSFTNGAQAFAYHFTQDGERVAAWGGEAGDVEIYERSGGLWGLASTIPIDGLPWSLPAVVPHYLRSLALSGDVLVWGAGPSNRFEIRRFDGSDWILEYTEEQVGPTGSSWGDDVAVDGDTALVSGIGSTYWMPTTDTSFVRIYRYDPVAQAWGIEATLSPPADHYPVQPSGTLSATPGSFGNQIAIQGDLAVVGAAYTDTDAVDAGAVYIYRRAGTSWSLTDTITPSEIDPGIADYTDWELGLHLALEGERLIVSAPHSQNDYLGNYLGLAYVLDLSGGTVTVEGRLQTVRPAYSFGWANDADWGAGRSLALHGDVAVVGAPFNRNDEFGWASAQNHGTTYVFARNNGVWSERADCEALFAYQNLGYCVAIVGDQVLASAPHGLWVAQGQVFLFDGVASPPNTAPVADAGADQVVSEGQSVDLDGSGSFDGDGDPLSYAWTQVSGTAVSLVGADTATPTFVAPSVGVGGETLSFSLIVSDGQATGGPDTVSISVANVNHPPVADVGLDQTVSEGSIVTLDGTGSFDVDDDPLTFQWVQLAGTPVDLSSSTTSTVSFTAPEVGSAGDVLTFALVVSDGIDVSEPALVSIQVTNVNQPPIAVAGQDQTVDEHSPVFLNGTGSTDPDGDPLSYSWSQVSGPAVALSGADTAAPSFQAPDVSVTETLVFRLTVADGQGGEDTATTSVLVRDVNAPPDCSLAAPTLDRIWPPNHKLVAVGVIGVSDPEDSSISIEITAVTQDEPVDGLGDGDTGPDAVIQGSLVLLRAERSGLGDGRVYHVHFTATDPEGAQCSGVVTVCVPHSKKSVCVDQGPLFDSTVAP